MSFPEVYISILKKKKLISIYKTEIQMVFTFKIVRKMIFTIITKKVLFNNKSKMIISIEKMYFDFHVIKILILITLQF